MESKENRCYIGEILGLVHDVKEALWKVEVRRVWKVTEDPCPCTRYKPRP